MSGKTDLDTYRTVYVSFGGLLLALQGSYRHFEQLDCGASRYTYCAEVERMMYHSPNYL